MMPKRTGRAALQAAEPELDPVLDFMRLLWGIEHRLQSTSKRMAASMGVTGPQRLVLRLVAQFPGMSPGEVAHLVRLHPSTVTGILQRLEAKGLLARDTHPADSRRARLHVRPAARALTSSSSAPEAARIQSPTSIRPRAT